MSPLLAIAMLFCAIVGGVIGWRRASTPLQRRLPSEKHTTPEEAAQGDLRRRLHRRFRLTLIYALLGVVVGLFALLFVDRR